MWSYYGRKSKVVKYYPKPQYKTIIEPFAGTAVYSLYQNNWKNQVILIEKDIVLIKIWRYLQQASPNDILSLPNVKQGDDLRKYTFLSQEERWLMGFCNARGTPSPHNIVTKWARMTNLWENVKPRIAKNLYKIRHWDIIWGTYEICPEWKATWFIDPPYQFGGHRYSCSNKDIDFLQLKQWCLSRLGQVIVCENSKATWLPFIPMKEMQGSYYKTMECIYVNSI